MAMKQSSKIVMKYLQSLPTDANVTATDVAETLDLDIKSVNGVFTGAIQRRGLGVRVPAQIELEDGSNKDVKFLQLTDEGRAFNVDAEEDKL